MITSEEFGEKYSLHVTCTVHVQDVKTVVGDISGVIQQLKNLTDVRLEKCCDELIRGVVEGLRRKQTPRHQVPSSQGKPVIATVLYIFEVHAGIHINYKVCTHI